MNPGCTQRKLAVYSTYISFTSPLFKICNIYSTRIKESVQMKIISCKRDPTFSVSSELTSYKIEIHEAHFIWMHTNSATVKQPKAETPKETHNTGYLIFGDKKHTTLGSYSFEFKHKLQLRHVSNLHTKSTSYFLKRILKRFTPYC
jgi:hypothetical protein